MSHHKKRRAVCAPRCALFRLARQLDPEPEHAFQVRKNAERLFKPLGPLHGLGADAWKLLEAAAVLHDIGHRRGFAKHHKHARDMIMERKWPGLDKRERAITACVARYHRKGPPDPAHRVYRDLGAPDQVLVARLAALLRLADGLDRAHAASVRSIGVEISDETVVLHVAQRVASPADIEGARRKAALFEGTFHRELLLVLQLDVSPK